MRTDIYVLYYRAGNNPHPMFFFFVPTEAKGLGKPDIRVIVERCKRHCELMNYRFVNVRPAFVDMDAAEMQVLGQAQPETPQEVLK